MDDSLTNGRIEILRREPAPVDRPDGKMQTVVDRLLEVMRKAGYPALSAPQIGVPMRLLAVDLSCRGDRAVVLANPEIESVSLEQQVDTEGCVSLPGITARVRRPVQVTVTGWARTGHRVRIHAGGILARILQHEMDHLSGVLLPDHLPPAERRKLLDRAGGTPPACPLHQCGRLAGAAVDGGAADEAETPGHVSSAPSGIRPRAPEGRL